VSAPLARIEGNEKNKVNRPNEVMEMNAKNLHSLKQNGKRNRKKKRKRRKIDQGEEVVVKKKAKEADLAEDGTEAPENRGARQQKGETAGASQGRHRLTYLRTRDREQNRKPGSTTLPLRVTQQVIGEGQSSTTG